VKASHGGERGGRVAETTLGAKSLPKNGGRNLWGDQSIKSKKKGFHVREVVPQGKVAWCSKYSVKKKKRKVGIRQGGGG